MGLISDLDMPPTPADVPSIRQQYIEILQNLQIRTSFKLLTRDPLSTEVGVFKPDRRVL